MEGRFLLHLCNRCFPAVMFLQIVLWVYLCLGTSDTMVYIRGKGQMLNTEISDVTKPQDLKEANIENSVFKVVKAGGDKLNANDVPLVVPMEVPDNIQSENENLSTDEIMKRYYNPVVGHTILPRDPSLVLNRPYLTNPSTLCSRHEDLDLVVVVHTSPYNFRRRELLRDTFNNPSVTWPYTVQLVFIIGVQNSSNRNEEKENVLASEISKHGDFVQMGFHEHFRNLSLKSVTWLRWVNESCPQAMMVLKIDDDVIIDLRRMLPLSRGFFSKLKRSIFCNVNKVGSQPIPRRGRTLVDSREFYNQRFYPYTYCSGFIVFISRDLIPQLAQAVHETPLYNVDDVYTFGMLPRHIGDVSFYNLGYNVSVWSQKVYNCTEVQGTGCRYYATMAADEAEALRVMKVMERSHLQDFHIPHLRVVKRNKEL